jgi:hypothetical protein
VKMMRSLYGRRAAETAKKRALKANGRNDAASYERWMRIAEVIAQRLGHDGKSVRRLH